MIIACVDNNVVVEIDTIDPSEYQTYAQAHQIVLDITDIQPAPQVGWIFNGSILVSNGSFNWKITRLGFRERFQLSELMALYTAMSSNPVLQIMQDNEMAAQYIDLSSVVTQSAVGYLVSLGIITSDRATAILTTPPAPLEVYTG